MISDLIFLAPTWGCPHCSPLERCSGPTKERNRSGNSPGSCLSSSDIRLARNCRQHVRIQPETRVSQGKEDGSGTVPTGSQEPGARSQEGMAPSREERAELCFSALDH